MLRQVHRWTGLFAALFLAVLAVTGLLINHAHELGLDQSQVRSAWLLDHYGLPEPEPAIGAIGAVTAGDLIVAADTNQLLLLTPDGELVERMTAAALPGRILRIGTLEHRIVVETPDGVFVADADLLEWTATSITADAVGWSDPAAAPAAIVDAMDPVADSPSLSWERILLDLHGGRLFGLTGRIIADLTALAILYLLISGLITWRRNGRGRR